MAVVSGDLKLVTDNPAGVQEVWIRAPKVRLNNDSVILGEPDPIPVGEDGVLTFTAVPGPVMITPMVMGPYGRHEAVTTLEGAVPPDRESVTLAEVLEHAIVYEPPVVSRVAKDAADAREAAERAVAGAATVGDAQTVLAAREEAVEAATSAQAWASSLADTILIESPPGSGLFAVSGHLVTEDPDNPGLYLIGA